MSHGYGVAEKAMRELLITHGARGKGGTGAATFEGQQVSVELTAKETLAQDLMLVVCTHLYRLGDNFA